MNSMYDEAKEKALSYLLRRVRSEYEMRTYLAEGGYDEVIDEVIDFLYHYDYLDDAAFAGMYIRDKLRFAPCGVEKLRYELEEKGIEGFIIEEALEENLSLDKEAEVALRLLETRQRGERNKEKLKRYLYSKGFSHNAIYASIRALDLTERP